jgi:Legume lectin domain
MSAHITYDGLYLTVTLTDDVTQATWSFDTAIDIPFVVGETTAYVGFTGGSGGLTANQQVVSWTYVSGPPALPDYPDGFLDGSQLNLNGVTGLSGSALELTNGGKQEAGSAFFTTPVNIQSFTADFTFRLSNPSADGMTFTIENVGPTALGSPGGGLGYAGIGKSVAVKFDLYNNAGEGADSTGIYVDGAAPSLPSVNLSSTGINLHSGDSMRVHLIYDGTYLTVTLTDQVTLATWSFDTAINIPSIVDGTTAYVGFTGGTGGLTANQNILSWVFANP